MKYKLLILLLATGLLGGCAPTRPIITYASENSISIEYRAYADLPTLTAEAIDMAMQHCGKHGAGAVHMSSRAKNPFTTKETHTFACSVNRVEVKKVK